MKLAIIAAALLSAAPLAAAPSPWTGTWKIEDATYKSDTTSRRMLKDGLYSSTTLASGQAIKADGEWHPVADTAYDAAKVTVDGPDKVTVTMRKAGRELGRYVLVVAADGGTVTGAYTDLSMPKGATDTSTFTRVGALPAGAHAVSGEWRLATAKTSDATSTVIIADHGDTLDFTDGNGIGYSAKFDGPAVAMKNDPTGTMAAVKRTGTGSIVETDSRGGKVVGVGTWTLRGDGRAIDIVIDDREHGQKFGFTAVKQ